MKLATRKNDTRDGELLVVSQDNQRAVLATDIAPTMQALFDNWGTLAPKLEDIYRSLNQGERSDAFDVDAHTLHSPLPRAYGWIDGRRYALDKDRTIQLICKRKQQNWTQTYRNRVEKLLLDGKLKEAGLATMRLAQQNGTWLANQNVDNLETPNTLLDALDVEQGLAWWQSAALSHKRNVSISQTTDIQMSVK